MALANVLAEYREHQVTAVRRCCVARWGMGLETEADIAAFQSSIRDFSISTRELHNLFRKAGADYSAEALRRHRNQDCGCQN